MIHSFDFLIGPTLTNSYLNITRLEKEQEVEVIREIKLDLPGWLPIPRKRKTGS